jgi:hypothetical protein
MPDFDAAHEELIHIRDAALNEAHRAYDEALAALRRDSEPAPEAEQVEVSTPAEAEVPTEQIEGSPAPAPDAA